MQSVFDSILIGSPLLDVVCMKVVLSDFEIDLLEKVQPRTGRRRQRLCVFHKPKPKAKKSIQEDKPSGSPRALSWRRQRSDGSCDGNWRQRSSDPVPPMLSFPDAEEDASLKEKFRLRRKDGRGGGRGWRESENKDNSWRGNVPKKLRRYWERRCSPSLKCHFFKNNNNNNS